VLITALTAIVVALIHQVGSRIDRRDMRNRLSKEVEILDKLPKDSTEYHLLKNHVRASVLDLVIDGERERKRRRLNEFDRFIIGLGVIALGTWFALEYVDLGRFKSLFQWAAVIVTSIALLLGALLVVSLVIGVTTESFKWVKRKLSR
jgi:hypothetical protein